MNKQNVFAWTVMTTMALSGCNCPKKEAAKFAAFNADNMDLTMDPAVDFYQYANGGWIKQHPLPDDKSRFGAFDLLAEENRDKVKLVIEQAAQKGGEPGSVSQQIGDFFASGMDTVRRAEMGWEPIKPLLDKVAEMDDASQVTAMTAFLHHKQIAPFFYFYSTPDQKNSNMVIGGIHQGGLGLPDRDYYLENDTRTTAIRDSYRKYLETLHQLIGLDQATAQQKTAGIIAFETQLAKVSNTRLENRDPQKTYNKMDVANLEKVAPNFQWSAYIQQIGLSQDVAIDVAQPAYVAALSELIATTDLAIIKDYMQMSIVRSAATYLSPEFEQASFEMYGKTLSGKQAMEPQWKRVLNTTSGALGEAVGQLYVQQFFPEAAKARVETLVENLRTAFGQRVDQLTWMTDSTKKAAHEKLGTIRVKVGYPNKWRDYSPLAISKDSYWANVLASNEFDAAFDLAKIGKPVDKDEWLMNPQTVNAYYNPVANEIVFPAAILQPPFFYAEGDDAVNYGAIGVVIGHEMTHGFDDQGRQYDKDGNLTDWWTAQDAENFNAKTKVLIDRFNGFTVIDTLKANGELTLGENIADFGGLSISYQAFTNSCNNQLAEPVIDGFTPQQRFILGYSRVWAQNIRNEEVYRLTKEDVHSLGKWRVNGPLPLFAPFYQAFKIQEGSAMFVPENERPVIW